MKTLYPSHEAVYEMGIICAKSSADVYICNMYKAGLFRTTYKLSGKWHVTKTDIDTVHELIITGKYKPSAKCVRKN